MAGRGRAGGGQGAGGRGQAGDGQGAAQVTAEGRYGQIQRRIAHAAAEASAPSFPALLWALSRSQLQLCFYTGNLCIFVQQCLYFYALKYTLSIPDFR